MAIMSYVYEIETVYNVVQNPKMVLLSEKGAHGVSVKRSACCCLKGAKAVHSKIITMLHNTERPLTKSRNDLCYHSQRTMLQHATHNSCLIPHSKICMNHNSSAVCWLPPTAWLAHVLNTTCAPRTHSMHLDTTRSRANSRHSDSGGKRRWRGYLHVLIEHACNVKRR